MLIPSILLRSYNLTCKSNGQLMSYAQSRSQLQDWIWSILLHIKQNSNWLSLGTSGVFLMELINLVMQIYKLLARYQIICKIKCQFCLYFSAKNTRKYFWEMTMIIFDMDFWKILNNTEKNNSYLHFIICLDHYHLTS